MRSVAVPIARPSIGSAGKTGLWRVHRPVIDYSKCTSCLLCWLYCPEGAITPGERPTVDYDYCKGCGICSEECPTGAIRMVKEGGEG